MSEDEEVDLMYEYFFKELTPGESKRQHDEAIKCAELIRKKGMTPNLDYPEE
jgi:hypothetical protein